MSQSLALPISIVLAGALVGTGLYFGMRARAAPPTVTTVPSVLPSSAETPTLAVTDAGSAPPDPLANPAAYAGLQAKALVRLKSAIEAKRATWVTNCWKPSAALDPTPARETFEVRVLFDGSGKRSNFSAGMPSAKSRADVAKCLSEDPPNVTIDPAKTLVGVQYAFELP